MLGAQSRLVQSLTKSTTTTITITTTTTTHVSQSVNDSEKYKQLL